MYSRIGRVACRDDTNCPQWSIQWTYTSQSTALNAFNNVVGDRCVYHIGVVHIQLTWCAIGSLLLIQRGTCQRLLSPTGYCLSAHGNPNYMQQPTHSYRVNNYGPQQCLQTLEVIWNAEIGTKPNNYFLGEAPKSAKIDPLPAHKLQGSGVNNLFVHNWSYVTNWVYIMLSRVKTQAGLFSRKNSAQTCQNMLFQMLSND